MQCVNPNRLPTPHGIRQTPQAICSDPVLSKAISISALLFGPHVTSSHLTWAGICALSVFCSVSMMTPGVVLAKDEVCRSVAGLAIPAWLAPVLTSDPFPKARMAFSGTEKWQRSCAEKDTNGSLTQHHCSHHLRDEQNKFPISHLLQFPFLVALCDVIGNFYN